MTDVADKKQLVWARDGDSENAVEHPAYLLSEKTPGWTWIEWASNGSIVCVPRHRIRLGALAPRRSASSGTKGMQSTSSSSTSHQQQQTKVKEEEIKIMEEPDYNYETDEDDGNFPKVTVTPPSPVRSMSAFKGKSSFDDKMTPNQEEGNSFQDKVRVKGEDYEYDTDGSLSRENYNNGEGVEPDGKVSIDLDKLDVGSRVVAICGKGKRWNATIRNRYKKKNMSGFLLHYDGNKKSSETWVPEHRVVDLIPDEVDTESSNKNSQARMAKKQISSSEGKQSNDTHAQKPSGSPNMHDCAGMKSSGKKRKNDPSLGSTESRKKQEVSPKLGNKFTTAALATANRSKKQKEIPRQLIASDISFLGSTLCESGNWNLKQTSFRNSEIVPLDLVHFDEEKNRYQVESGSNVTDDDVIIQAMVVFSLYRMEMGWSKGTSWKALSIWSGEPAAELDIFPLKNLWKEEIQDTIAQKKLGKTTLAHNDNFDNFPRYYGTSTRKRWRRRSDTYVGQVHIFAEQAAIQVALHLHRNVSREYAYLASLLIHFALNGDDGMMYPLSACLLNSARKESDHFPKIAFDDMIAAIERSCD